MDFRGRVRILAFSTTSLLWGMCGSSNTPSGEAPDALPLDALPADAVSPDALPLDGGQRDGGELCFWQTGSGYGLKHFRFLLTTPDGQRQVPVRDPGVAGVQVFEGRIASVDGNQFTVDRCLTPDTCQPSLYHFTLCSNRGSACTATDLPPSLPTVLPPNRRVRVEWGMDGRNVFSGGLYWLAITDAEKVAQPGRILFLGSGGYQPDYYGAAGTPLANLPFTVALRSLKCEEQRDAGMYWGDDYAFLFTSANPGDPPLRLTSGEAGLFAFTGSSGTVQTLQIRCLVAVQPRGVTDDMWNWDFWATNETPLETPPD